MPVYRITIPKDVDYGRAITLKRNIADHFPQDGDEIPQLCISIKKEDPCYYFTGTYEQAKLAVERLEKRCEEWTAKSATFRLDPTPIETKETHLTEEMETLIAETTERAREDEKEIMNQQYLHAMKALGDQLDQRSGMIVERDHAIFQLTEEKAQIEQRLKEERLNPEQVYAAFKDSLLRTTETGAMAFDLLINGMDEQKLLEILPVYDITPEKYAETTASKFAEAHGIADWKAYIGKTGHLKEFEKTVDKTKTEEYQKAKSERDDLLKAIEAAMKAVDSAEMKDFIKTNFAGALERRQSTINAYETEEQSYKRRTALLKEMNATYDKAFGEQSERRAAIDADVRSDVKNAEICFCMAQENGNVTVTVYKEKSDKSRYNKAISDIMASVAKGFSRKEENADMYTKYVFAAPDGKTAEDVQRDIYNRLTSQRENTILSKVGMKLSVYALPAHL